MGRLHDNGDRGCGASVARADERIVAKVPFAFIVNGVRLPAGDYVVRESSAGSGVLAITSADGQSSVCTLSIPVSDSVEAPAHPELIFEKFSNRYFLARVVPQDGDERELILTPAIMEREIVEADESARH